MFKVNRTREIFYPIKLNVLKEDGSGTVDEVTIKIKYKLLTRKELKAWLDESKKALLDADVKDTDFNVLLDKEESFVVERVTDWDGLIDESTNEKITFAKELLISAMEESTQFASKVVAGLYAASQDEPVKN